MQGHYETVRLLDQIKIEDWWENRGDCYNGREYGRMSALNQALYQLGKVNDVASKQKYQDIIDYLKKAIELVDTTKTFDLRHLPDGEVIHMLPPESLIQAGGNSAALKYAHKFGKDGSRALLLMIKALDDGLPSRHFGLAPSADEPRDEQLPVPRPSNILKRLWSYLRGIHS